MPRSTSTATTRGRSTTSTARFSGCASSPGEHEIEIYKDGFRPLRQKVYLTADNTFRIKQALQPLATGEQTEPRPQPVNPPQGGQPYGQQPQNAPMPRGRSSRPAPPPAGWRPARRPAAGATRRTAVGGVRAQSRFACSRQTPKCPIDGEDWRGPAGQDRLVDRPRRRVAHSRDSQARLSGPTSTQVDVQPRGDDAAERQPAAGVGTVRLKADTTFVRSVRLQPDRDRYVVSGFSRTRAFAVS